MKTAARRSLLGGLVAGGAVTMGAQPAAAARSYPREIPVRDLRSGDLIVGPNASIIRIASRRKLASGRHRLRYSHPNTGVPTDLPGYDAQSGLPGRRRVVLLMRRVPVSAIQLSPVPSPGDPDVIDGGTP